MVVGIDAGDWAIIDPLLQAGRLPNLQRLLDGGVRADLGTLVPMLSPLLWTTIATGTLPDRHGILDFLTLDPVTGNPAPVSRRQRRDPAIWNVLTQYGVSQGVIGWLATWPAEAVSGILVTDRFGFLAFAVPEAGDDEGMTWPPDYAARARELEVRPSDRDAAFWSRFANAPPQELMTAGERGFEKGDLAANLALTVATALTNTAVAEDVHARLNPRFLAVYYEMVDAVGHLAMPYAPPRREGVDESLYRRYSGTLDAAYALQDELLGRLLALAGDDTMVLVLSDHGFKSGQARPVGSAEIWGGEAAQWHREPGILVLHGPGVRRGVRLERRVELVDIAPTMLAILGMPVPESMEGRFVAEAFTPEGRERYAPQRTAALDLRPEVWSPPPVPAASLTGRGEVAATYHNNLGLVLEHQGKLPEAEAEFRRALESDPGDRMARTNLGGVLLRSGRLDEARKLLEAANRDHPGNVPTLFNLALLLQTQGGFEEAGRRYREVLSRDPSHAAARVNLGHVLLRQGRRDEAAAEFTRVLERAPDTPNAHFGLALIAVERGDLPRAAAEFRRTLALDPGHASAAGNLEAVERALAGN
jgi:Flp pilus assembly protein TadD/arylsulfatase A-like enzyme